MAITRETRKQIEAGRFDELEDHWLARLAEEPHDLDHFVGVARAFAGAGEGERTAGLLELLDEELTGAGDWARRLDLLERAGHLFVPAERLHEEILETLRRLYPDHAEREGLLELVGLHRAVDDIPKTWQKLARARAVLEFGVGRPVAMQGKGIGHVADVNVELKQLKVRLDGQGEVSVGFRAAAKLLEPLPPGSFLYRKLEERESLRRQAEAEPAALVRAFLGERGRAVPLAELREAMRGVVDDGRWSAWWAGIKEHPQLVVRGRGARQTLAWAESGEEARAETEKAFAAADLAGKLAIFRRESRRDEELGATLATELARLAAAAVPGEPATAFRVWAALDAAGLAAAAAAAGWEPSDLLALGGGDWIPELDDRPLKRRAVELARAHLDAWPELFERLLHHEEDPPVLALLATELGKHRPQLLDAFFDDLLAQPHRRPAAFVWAVESLSSQPVAGERNPLRLLRQILGAGQHDAFAPFRARLRKVIEDGRALAALIATLDSGQAAAAEQALERAPLARPARDRLLDTLYVKFPDLREPQVEALWATAAAIEERKAELRRLLEEEIPANRKAIQEARELGDLRENFEYKSARQRHEYLSARVGGLNAELARARPIDFAALDTSQVSVGCRVRLAGGEGGERNVTILGPWESRPEEGVISYETETAARLLGKKPGDRVEIDGAQLEIAAIETASG